MVVRGGGGGEGVEVEVEVGVHILAGTTDACGALREKPLYCQCVQLCEVQFGGINSWFLPALEATHSLADMFGHQSANCGACTCMGTHMHAHTHTHTHTHIYTHTYVVNNWLCTYMHTCFRHRHSSFCSHSKTNGEPRTEKHG